MSKSAEMDSTFSGTTACMAMVHNGYVYAANVGDSGACLGRLGANGRIQGVELTKYAKPNDPQVGSNLTHSMHLSHRDLVCPAAECLAVCMHAKPKTC